MVGVSLSGIIILPQWVISSANRLKGNDKNIFALYIHAGIFIYILKNKCLVSVFLPHTHTKRIHVSSLTYHKFL